MGSRQGGVVRNTAPRAFVVRFVAGLVLALSGFILTFGAVSRILGGSPPPVTIGLDAYQIEGYGWSAIVAATGIALSVAAYLVRAGRRPELVVAICFVAALLALIAGANTGAWAAIPLFVITGILVWMTRVEAHPTERSDQRRP
jgi:uncharacterized protein YbjT (DUF2867 family)